MNRQKIKIYGIGQTSMIAAIMLSKNFDVELLDSKKEVKQSHFALLRFGTDKIEKETGIKLKETKIKKAVYYKDQLYNESNIKFDNMYSFKVTGKIQNRSIGNLGVGKRYIPPVDFFDQLKAKTEHMFKLETTKSPFHRHPDNTIHISTKPMPEMHSKMKNDYTKAKSIDFDFEEISVVEYTLPNYFCDVDQTIYYPHPDDPAYRISIVGNVIKFELTRNNIMKDHEYLGTSLNNLHKQFCDSFGIKLDHYLFKRDCKISQQKFGKISPIDEDIRKYIIYSLTKEKNIYSLGRFACWRNILLDDVIEDVKAIENMLKFQALPEYERNKLIAA